MEIAYAAHTRTCTFLLDSEGICRDVVGADGVARHDGPTAERCIGAQYVASLDAETPGILVDMPRIGLPIVFARVDVRGRVSLVRTGVLLRLEPRRPSMIPAAVATAPIPSISPMPPARASEPPQKSAEYPIRHEPFTAPQDDDTLFEDARTQRFDLAKHGIVALAPAGTAGAASTGADLEASEGPATIRHAESHAYVPTERAQRISDIVPKQPAATYEERVSIFPPISKGLHDPALDDAESLSPYAIPLRRVK